MSEMVERVALAISGGDDPASILGIHRSRARLGIESMRTIPPEILSVIAANRGVFDWDVEAVWEAVIDEALK